MNTIRTFNPGHASREDIGSFQKRVSVRAVLQDDENKVAVIYAAKLDYYALPGGTVDPGETTEVAVVREIQEEVGCDSEIVAELGMVEEVRADVRKVGEIYGYVLKVVGQKGEPQLMDDEIEEGFVVEWHAPEDLIKIFQNEVARHPQEHKHIGERALAFLEVAFPGA